MTTKTLGRMVHFAIILLVIAPFLYVVLISLRGNMEGIGFVEMLQTSASSVVSLMSVCILPFAGFLLKSKWDNIDQSDDHAREYYYFSLLLTLLSLLLIGNTGMVFLIFLLMIFSVMILRVRLSNAVQAIIKAPNKFAKFGGEMVLLLLAIFVRFAIWRLSNAG